MQPISFFKEAIQRNDKRHVILNFLLDFLILVRQSYIFTGMKINTSRFQGFRKILGQIEIILFKLQIQIIEN